MMEQRQRLLKARIALALYAKYGQVPKVGEINRFFYERIRLGHTQAELPTIRLRRSSARQQPTLFSLSPATKYPAEFRKTRSFISLS